MVIYSSLGHLSFSNYTKVLVHSKMGLVVITVLLILAFSLYSQGSLWVLGLLVFSRRSCGSGIECGSIRVPAFTTKALFSICLISYRAPWQDH